MRISVKVHPGAKIEKMEETGDGVWEVWTREPAKENKANFAVLEIVALHFGVSMARVRFVAGVKSKNKTLEVI